jgi:hypothetical protein
MLKTIKIVLTAADLNSLISEGFIAKLGLLQDIQIEIRDYKASDFEELDAIRETLENILDSMNVEQFEKYKEGPTDEEL